MKGKILLLISTLCFVMFVGCATSIPVNIQRPSALDLGDAETVCVVPFKLHEFDDNIKFSGFIINFGSIVSSEKERKEEVLVSTYITKQLQKHKNFTSPPKFSHYPLLYHLKNQPKQFPTPSLP